ncbi:MAG: lysine--tRNA ligase [bacterium]|nr:lysine--tRNA ligase [bacterium]MCP5071192.1 lysine--tRNA ligase [bacterium]
MSENEQDARRARLEALRQAGVDPFPARVAEHTSIAALRVPWEDVSAEVLEAEMPPAAIAGRIKAHRSFGKLLFMTLVEDGVAMQVCLRKQEVTPEVFDFSKKLDVGDFVRAEGFVWRTKKGELTLDARDVTMLAKCLQPLPEKWHGLADVETRYRQRYLDLLSNEEARTTALLRSRVTTALRQFLGERGFLEVETPVLQPIYGGAAARPFTTHHNMLDQQLYLRISDELYLKRLVIGGLDRIYEIGHNFRNEGISKKHNPEFTMLECYQAFADYRDMMDLTEAMVGFIAESVLGTTSVEFQGTKLELGRPWPRITIRDAILEKTGVDMLAAADLPSLQQAVRDAGKDPGEAPTWGVLVDDLFSDYVEPTLIQPTFITDHPVELSPLAKRSSEDPRLVERFEPFIGGMEIGNAFSELNDPDDQRQRFETMGKAREQGDEEAHPMDEAFLLALEHGMPPTGGLGIGVDRLVMVLADASNLREVILFPHLRPEGD